MRWYFGVIASLLLTALLAAPGAARADIVFVNMNGSVTEIPAAQAAATQLGERLYVLPAQETPGYDTEQLTRDLVRLAKIGVRPRAMVVSGHHVKNQGYFGSNGEISLHRITALVANEEPQTQLQVQSFFASLQSLYLMGCYTGTLTNADRLVLGYNTVFTNTKFVVGFADKAPISTNADSGRVLKTLLLRESQLRQTPATQLPQLISSISTTLDIIVHRGNTFATKDGSSEVDSFIASCQNAESKQAILDAVLLVWKYYWNEVGPLPEETGKGPLREAYRHLQRNNFCLQMGVVELNQVQEIPALSTVIRLIFYKNVVNNFARLYANALLTVQKEFAALGIQNTEFLTQLEQTERGLLMEKLSGLHKSVKKALPGFTSDPEQRAKYLYYYRMINDIEAVIYPSEDFIPQSWIDPISQERTRFRVLNNFEKGKASARKKAFNQLVDR